MLKGTSVVMRGQSKLVDHFAKGKGAKVNGFMFRMPNLLRSSPLSASLIHKIILRIQNRA
ncbi:hypothetical protein AT248_03620 [Bartonella henselae]|nr:hypothetical protein BhenCHDE101_07165 [Bartonella henselae]PNM38946.1 hypothetical protein AL470_006470 [Bartonella henselae str. Houston-1]OLL41159.1 hypothetical protein AT237_00045 [Bartonella henselae]OLL42389.1 hypothetical protein AT244_02775 [Bartonella henselae]OLL44202.1 hypothetical protein AT245_01560 [Bartonella henselae]